MRNCIITILGSKGAGKTQLSRRLLKDSPRVIILDRLMEHEGDFITTDPEAAVNFLAENWRGKFRLVARFRNDMATGLFLRYIVMTAERCKGLPIALVVEEADFYASPHGMEPSLAYIYNYGRHFCLNIMAIARGDTDLHRTMINNSDYIIACRMQKFSKEMREKFSADEIDAIRRLRTIEPKTVAVKGVNYFVYPDDDGKVDVFKAWRENQSSYAVPQGA